MDYGFKYKWVLLVDDDPDVRELIKEKIKNHYSGDVRTIEASDGHEANLKLINQAFDLIITDLQMPNVDGQHFIEFVKKSALNESTPIIVVTGFPDMDLFNRYDEISHLDKPFDTDDLIKAIETQFKLGRLDKRVDAEVVNTFLKVCYEFAGKLLDVKAELQNPISKKPSDPAQGEVVCLMKIVSKHGSCHLGIGLDAHFINAIKERFSAKADQTKLIEGAVHVVFKSTQAYIHKNTGASPTIKEKVVISAENQQQNAKLTSTKGIIVPIKTEHGTLFAHSLSLKNNSSISKAS